MRRPLLVLTPLALLIAAALPAPAGAAVTNFSNPAPINGPSGGVDIGQASPSPSPITVSGVQGVVTDLNIFFNGVTSGRPTDIHALLVGPFGQSVVLMNAVGGSGAVAGVNPSFNDEAAGPLLGAGPLLSQGYEPSDNSPQPGLEPHLDVDAPPPPHGLTLSLVDGTSPNGTWNLYTADDINNTFVSTIAGGWSMSITSTDPLPPANNTGTPANTQTTTTTPGTTAKKKCKKGRKLKRGKCVKKKKK